MDFRRRLLVAFLIMTLLPVVLLVGIGVLILNKRTSRLENLYGNGTKGYVVIQDDSISKIDRLTEGTYQNLRYVTGVRPRRMREQWFLDEMGKGLAKQNAFLVVLENNRVTYCGNREYYQMLVETMPQYEDFQVDIECGIYMGQSVRCLIKWHDFYFEDGTLGTFMIISDVEDYSTKTDLAAGKIISIAVIIFFCTGAAAVYWLYTGMVKPIKQLQQATKRVKDGDLDFRMESGGEDEIGDLCRDFEGMRSHLKAEIDARMGYEEELRNLIGNISHDLKTPLTSIRGYAEGLMEGVAATPEKQAKYLTMIRTKAEAMSSMVEELTLYTQIDCKSYPYYFEDMNLNNYLNDILEETGFDLEQKNIGLVYDKGVADDTVIVGDREQIRRVITNIVSNSIKYGSQTNNVITVKTENEGNYVRVSISDVGEGVPEDDVKKLFNRFFRADSSRNSGKGGTGLGLSVVKQIIEDHGGTIRAESTLGVGTTISFTLRKGKQEEGG